MPGIPARVSSASRHAFTSSAPEPAPADTTCPSPSSGTGELDITIPSLPKDAALQFTFTGQVVHASNPEDDYIEFFNTASIALPQGSDLTDPVSGNNQSTAGVQVLDVIFKNGFEASTP